jgi:hypothetical protein
VFLNRAEKGFWHDIKVNWSNSLVIFDAKNKTELKPSDADQMLRYASAWRGNVLFLVCRKRQSKSFSLRTTEYLKEKRVCIIVLTDGDLEEMLDMKQQGSDPTVIIEKLFRELITS